MSALAIIWLNSGSLSMGTTSFRGLYGDTVITMCGPGVKHEPCVTCGMGSEALCDFPLTENRTCDAWMCDEHSNVVSLDVHYCGRHFAEWQDFRESGGVQTVLEKVVPLDEKYTGRHRRYPKKPPGPPKPFRPCSA